MKYSKYTILIPAVLSMVSIQETISQETRDPQKWPFADTSIWNTPIGTGAMYVNAKIQEATDWGMTIDEDLIVMCPEAYLMTILESDAGWDRNKSRCISNGKFHLQVPIPGDFIVSPENWDGLTPNSGLAVLMPDGITIKQTQPFAHCDFNDYATSKYLFGDVSILGDGRSGAHGGSGLSAIGGTIRLGELAPGGEIRHVMKVNVFGMKNLYYDDVTKGYRWPAYTADAYAKNNYGTLRTPPAECRMGALLSLPVWIDLDTFQLETMPAKILARAFQNYGAYIVDDTGWDVYGLPIEWGPDGRVADEFESVWGFDITSILDTPWARDIRKIFMNLYVVDNNSQDSIGGGGDPIAALPPSFGRSGNHYPIVTITSPLSFSVLEKGIHEIKANASDDDGTITKVEFYANGIFIGEDHETPFSIQWNINNDGEYLLVARATDNEYLSAVSHGIMIKTYENLVADTILYSENFIDNEAQGWDLASTTWTLQNQELKVLQADCMGSYIAFYNQESFSDYYYSMKAKPEWNNWLGAIFNLQDNQNYYLFNIHTTPAECKLVKIENGVESDVATGSYTGGGAGSWYSILIKNSDSLTSVWVNNSLVFDKVSTSTFISGRTGIYSWYQPSSFDDIVVCIDPSSNVPDLLVQSIDAGSHSGDADKSHDDNPFTSWTSDSTLNNGWIEFYFGQFFFIKDLDINFFKSAEQTYTYKITAGETEINGLHASIANESENIELNAFAQKIRIQLTEQNSAGTYEFGIDEIIITGLPIIPTNQPPLVVIAEPDSGMILDDGKSYLIKADASDTDGVVSYVELFKGREKIGTVYEAPYTFIVGNAVQGKYRFLAVAYDDDGAFSFSNEIIVNVKQLENDLPVVSITYPADSAEFVDGSNFTIKVDAFDTDGMISNIDIISNGEVLKSDPRPLYNYDWYGINEGVYDITAKVYSEGDQVIISDTVTIIVKKAVGLEEIQDNNNSIRIYPNPLKDENLVIEFDQDPQNASILFLSVNGKVLLNRKTNSKVVSIDINNLLSKGVYILKIRNNTDNIRTKLIVL